MVAIISAKGKRLNISSPEAAIADPVFWTSSVFWLDVAKAFFGAAFGAGFAFVVNILFQRRQRRRENLAAGNLALEVLRRQVSDFFNIRKAFLDDQAKRLHAAPNAPLWAQFKPMFRSFSEGFRFDYQALTFLFESGGTDAIGALGMAESRYTDLASIVETFNRTAENLQQRLVELGVQPGADFDVADVEYRLGPALVGKMNGLTKALLDRFEKDEKDYVAAASSLRAALLRSYKPNQVRAIMPVAKFTREQWADQ